MDGSLEITWGSLSDFAQLPLDRKNGFKSIKIAIQIALSM